MCDIVRMARGAKFRDIVRGRAIKPKLYNKCVAGTIDVLALYVRYNKCVRHRIEMVTDDVVCVCVP